MKNYLKYLFSKVLLLFKWIKEYIHSHKLKRMNQQLDNLLNILLDISDELFDDVKLVDGILLFRYREARFRITKSITDGNSLVGYLSLSQRTPFSVNVYEKKFEDVKDFYIKITLVDSYSDVRISNYLDLGTHSPTLHIDGTLTITDDNLAIMFVNQFKAKMKKENYTLYPGSVEW
ncbi:MAG: hypothetical protein V4560_16670 [Bacteroidota bacterium]